MIIDDIFKRVNDALVSTPFLPSIINGVECRAIVLRPDEVDGIKDEGAGWGLLMDETIFMARRLLGDHPWAHRAVGMYKNVLLLRPVLPKQESTPQFVGDCL